MYFHVLWHFHFSIVSATKDSPEALFCLRYRIGLQERVGIIKITESCLFTEDFSRVANVFLFYFPLLWVFFFFLIFECLIHAFSCIYIPSNKTKTSPCSFNFSYRFVWWFPNRVEGKKHCCYFILVWLIEWYLTSWLQMVCIVTVA